MRAPGRAARAAATLLLAACTGAPAPPLVLVSPTGVVYERGTPPTPTRNSQTATLYLRQDQPDRALEQVLEGIAADSGNPVHYFLAGAAYARLGDYLAADTMFARAERIYPAYELEVEPEREAAWGQAFNAGLEAYAEDDTERTLALWRAATVLYDLRPEAHRNLASLLALEARYDEAIDVYLAGLAGLERRPVTRYLTEEEVADREAATQEIEASVSELLFGTGRFAEAEPLLRRRLERDPGNANLRADLATAVAGQGREAEAQEMFEALLSEEGLAAAQLFSLGVGLFRASQFAAAADAFERLTGLNPHSRDAWFNYANALFAAEDWRRLAAAGPRLLEVDPLGENAHLITARAHLELGDREGALASLARVDEAPVYLAGLRLQRSEGGTTVSGEVAGNAAEPGTPLELRFTFYDDAGGELGSETLALAAPAAEGEPVEVEVRFPTQASAYRYELLNP